MCLYLFSSHPHFKGSWQMLEFSVIVQDSTLLPQASGKQRLHGLQVFVTALLMLSHSLEDQTVGFFCLVDGSGSLLFIHFIVIMCSSRTVFI